MEKAKKEQEKLRLQELVSKYEERSIYGRIFSYNKENVGTFIIGILATIVNGSIYPIFSIFLGTIINALF